MNYAVPAGMLETAKMVIENYDGELGNGLCEEFRIRMILETAIQWLAEHPLIPDDEQLYSISQTMDGSKDKYQCSRDLVAEWQRRMFLAPQPDPLVMYIERHFEDVLPDRVSIHRRAEAAAADYHEHLKRQ